MCIVIRVFMRHLKKGRKFGRERDQRRALKKGLASSFFLKGRITTTEAKAKEIRSFIEKRITRAKTVSLAVQRELARDFSSAVVKKVFEYGKDATLRPGGYTRIIKLGFRKSDSAKLAILELVK